MYLDDLTTVPRVVGVHTHAQGSEYCQPTCSDSHGPENFPASIPRLQRVPEVIDHTRALLHTDLLVF